MAQYWGYIPELAGASGSGDSLEEARASLAEGVRLWIQDARAEGEVIPKPSTLGVIPIDG